MHTPLGRRTFLRTAGIALALPFLESMTRAVAPGSGAGKGPRRLVAIGTPFGFDPTAFVPATTGRNYPLPSHLEHLREHRERFSVITGLSHPNTGGGGHKAEAVMLTGAPYPDYSYNLRNSISLDQEFASRFRGQTRYDSLALTTYDGTLSYTASGVAIPSISRPSQIFAQLFLTGSPAQAEEELRKIREGRSMLDFVGEQSRRLSRKVSAPDRARLDEYYDSVRGVEKQLQMAAEWVNRPKPKAPGPAPFDFAGPGHQPQKLQLMFDMIHLALVTDSTRAITIKTFGEHHDLSHHGKEPEKLAQCRQVEIELLKGYASLLTRLQGAAEPGGGTLLDHTSVLLTSNLRDGNTHWTSNLPVLLAGGGFRHGQHLAYNEGYMKLVATQTADPAQPGSGDPKPKFETPLSNLYVSLLQRAGIETDKFSSSTGRLSGLELV